MAYLGEFCGVDGINYKVAINTTGGISGGKILQFGGTPFRTSCKSEGKHIYAPLKTSGATITILTDTIEFDLYTGQAQGSKVTFSNSDTGQVLWVGYLTPCAYNMGFDENLEEIEVEAVDGIAVLKEIPYRSDSHDVDTFSNIIFNCLKQSGLYKNLYVTDNVQLKSANASISVIEQFRVSQQNFYDEKKDVNQEDDDVAWTCYDVLKQLMQFLGYTMFADGEDVIICDLDAIKAGNNKYFQYSLTGSTIGSASNATLAYSHYVDGPSYAKSGTSFSLDQVYNKVTVKDEFQSFDSLFPEFGDISLETNITAGNDSGLTSGLVGSSSYYLLGDAFSETNSKGNAENYEIFVAKNYENHIFACIIKYYSSPVFEFCKYNKSARTNVTASFNNSLKYSDMLANHGAYYVRMFKKEIKESEYNSWRADQPANFNGQTIDIRKAAWLRLFNSEPSKISLSPMVLMLNGSTAHIGPGSYSSNGSYAQTDNEHCRSFPYIRLKNTADSSAIFGGSDAYLIIKGSIISHDEENTPWPMADGTDNGDLKRGADYKFNDQFFNWARLKWGDRYWNGEAWTSSACDFKLWFHKQDGDKTRVKDYYDKEFEILDTAQADFGCSEKGYYIPSPKDGNLSGEAEFILYCPRDWWGRSNHDHWGDDNRYNRYYNYVQTLKNLSVKAYISNGFLDDKENDSDTYYTNVIANGSVSKMDEIKFKVCTNDNKKPNYSSVDYVLSGKSVYVTKTYNKANHNREKGSISSFDRKTLLTQEEHYIFKLATQYEEPRAVLEVTLKNAGHKLYGTYTDKTLSGRTFIADTIEVDYKANEAKIKLIEKA